MRIGSPVSIQAPAYYAGWYGASPRVIHVRARDERRAALALPPQVTGDAAQLTLFMAQTLREPSPLDAAVGRKAYALAQRDDDSILLQVDA
ncbi:hypothetical protein sos41_32740 [Alphaproteobacteria bacterium SO-S41]|nr:hypothetical protein sos41_32740 [Alphaproteobacteria bacterium SO-S41]